MLGILATIIVSLVLGGCGMSGDFDAEAWRAQHGSNAIDNPRSGQVSALERNHLRLGMARADVHALLGMPERQEELADHYDLGVSPVGVDYETYVIRYDARNLVSKFGVHRH